MCGDEFALVLAESVEYFGFSVGELLGVVCGGVGEGVVVGVELVVAYGVGGGGLGCGGDCGSGEGFDADYEFFHGEGFAYVVVGSGFESADDVVGFGFCCEVDDGCGVVGGAYLCDHVES